MPIVRLGLAASFEPLCIAVVALLAERNQLSIPEFYRITPVWLGVVDHVGRYDQAAALAPFAQRASSQLRLTPSLAPARVGVPPIVCVVAHSCIPQCGIDASLIGVSSLLWAESLCRCALARQQPQHTTAATLIGDNR